MKPTPKPKTVARRMWSKDLLNGWGASIEILQVVTVRPEGMRGESYTPVAVLDLRPEATARAVEQMAKRLRVYYFGPRMREGEGCQKAARAALEALCGKLPK